MKYFLKKNKRLGFSIVSTILHIRIEYLRGEIPIPDSDSLLIQIFGYFIAIPGLIIVAWFWDNKTLYNGLINDMKNPISYKNYIKLGDILFFLLMLFFLVITFVFPVSLDYHFGR